MGFQQARRCVVGYAAHEDHRRQDAESMLLGLKWWGKHPRTGRAIEGVKGGTHDMMAIEML